MAFKIIKKAAALLTPKAETAPAPIVEPEVVVETRLPAPVPKKMMFKARGGKLVVEPEVPLRRMVFVGTITKPRFYFRQDTQMLVDLAQRNGVAIDHDTAQMIWRRLSAEHPMAKNWSDECWLHSGHIAFGLSFDKLLPMLKDA